MNKSLTIFLVLVMIGAGFAMWIIPIWEQNDEVNTQIKDLVYIKDTGINKAEKFCDCKITKLSDAPIYLKLYDPSAPNTDWHQFSQNEVCGLVVTEVRTNHMRTSRSTRVAGYPFAATECEKLKSLSEVFMGL